MSFALVIAIILVLGFATVNGSVAAATLLCAGFVMACGFRKR